MLRKLLVSALVLVNSTALLAQVSYVRTWDATAPEVNVNTLMTRPLKDALMTTQYSDGLSRLVQTVVKQGSLETNGNTADLVIPIIYDDLGREQNKYLPFVANTTGGNTSVIDGLYKSNPLPQQVSFMTAQYGSQGESYFYSKTNFESSPLNRVEKTLPAGNSWVGTSRGTEIKYWVNTTIDAVRIWEVRELGGPFGSYVSPGTYPQGSLYKTVLVDEHGKQVIEFKDKDGQIILKKVQLTAVADNGAGSDHPGWLCTYYLYDDFNNLRCVVQPEGVNAIYGGWLLDNSTILNEQCFRYEYDGRNNMIKKKIPGSGEIWMVYDAKNRLVMTQDANLRSFSQKKWMYTLYDEKNRPITTGLGTDPNYYNNLSHHLSAASLSSSYPGMGIFSQSEELSNTFYDDYSWLGNYGFPVSSNYSNSYDSYLQSGSGLWPYPQSNVQSFNLKDKITGQRVKLVGTSTYLFVVKKYDENGRIIQSASTNAIGGTDVNTFQYSWSGQPLVVIDKQSKASGINLETIVVTQYSYDDLGRITKTEKKLSNSDVNSGIMPPSYKTLSQIEYDKLGQAKKKTLSPTGGPGGGILETLNYEFNIRGWMLGMNRDFAKDLNNANYFGFDLGYDKASNGIIAGQTYSNPQYNGNIEGTVWKSKGDGEKRKYDYVYDATNRLLRADFRQYSSGSFIQDPNINFDMKVGDGINATSAYDLNGNIRQLQHWGMNIAGDKHLDNLRYTYVGGSNRLKSVTDFKNSATSFLGDFKTAATHPQSSTKTNLTPTSAVWEFDTITDYAYDDNGNLIQDHNKSISSITYNHLNLPEIITIAGKGNVQFQYDAAGNKYKKIATDNSIANKTVTTITTYVGSLVFESKTTIPSDIDNPDYTDQLQFVGHEEGRIRFAQSNPYACTPANNKFVYDYFIRDHLGNIRSVLTEQNDDICYIPATVENSIYTTEKKIFDIVDARRIDKTITGATQSSFQDRLYRVHGGLPNEKTGLGAVLKVMGGDKVKLKVESFYTMPGGGAGPGQGTPALTELLSAFINSSPIKNGHGTLSTTNVSGIGTNSTDISTFLGQNNEGSNNARAFLNWILFDDQFKFITGGADEVQTNGGYKLHTKFINSPITISKNGYLYVFVSNESNLPVYFDNLSFTHTPGPIMQETHYYPFGLTMKGISANSLALTPQNKYKFNGGNESQSEEFGDNSGLEFLDAINRLYDPQLGRFWQVDDLAESNWDWSPYHFGYNNPITYNDPFGLEPEPNWITLSDVTVIGVRGLWAMTRMYYRLMKYTGGDLGRILNNSLREQMFRIDRIVKFRQRVADMTRAGDKIVLEIGSFFVPTGWVLKLKYAKYASKLFKLKRGGSVVKITEEAAEQTAKHADDLMKAASKTDDGVFLVTKEGVTLPKGAKIPSEFVEHTKRSSKYGVIENGKFVEKVRIDPATAPGFKGPNVSHFHLNDKGHNFDPTKWPWW